MKYLITVMKVVQFPIEAGDEPVVKHDGGIVTLHSKDGPFLTIPAAQLIEVAALADEPIITRPGPRAM